MSGWIGVDLDGTLAHYDKWVSVHHIGEPILPMTERVKGWLSKGEEVRIFTARLAGRSGDSMTGMVNAIDEWCMIHIGQQLPITNVKDQGMKELWDDRAVSVRKNTGEAVSANPIPSCPDAIREEK